MTLSTNCCEAMRLAVETLRKHGVDLTKVEGICLECKGSGEVGLSDGEAPCLACGGSGDPLSPGVMKKKTEHVA